MSPHFKPISETDRAYGLNVLRDTCAMLRRSNARRRAVEAAQRALKALPPRGGQTPPAAVFAVGVAFYAPQGVPPVVEAVTVCSGREGA